MSESQNHETQKSTGINIYYNQNQRVIIFFTNIYTNVMAHANMPILINIYTITYGTTYLLTLTQQLLFVNVKVVEK